MEEADLEKRMSIIFAPWRFAGPERSCLASCVSL